MIDIPWNFFVMVLRNIPVIYIQLPKEPGNVTFAEYMIELRFYNVFRFHVTDNH